MSTTSRRKFIGTAVLLSAAVASASALNLTNMEQKKPLVHHVFFWLKNPDSAEDLAHLITGIKTLSKIKGIIEFRVGVVANTEKRKSVDNSWSISELIIFKDQDAQDAYQKDPIHAAFVKNYSHLWKSEIVYDAVEA